VGPRSLGSRSCCQKSKNIKASSSLKGKEKAAGACRRGTQNTTICRTTKKPEGKFITQRNPAEEGVERRKRDKRFLQGQRLIPHVERKKRNRRNPDGGSIMKKKKTTIKGTPEDRGDGPS